MVEEIPCTDDPAKKIHTLQYPMHKTNQKQGWPKLIGSLKARAECFSAPQVGWMEAKVMRSGDYLLLFLFKESVLIGRIINEEAIALIILLKSGLIQLQAKFLDHNSEENMPFVKLDVYLTEKILLNGQQPPKMDKDLDLKTKDALIKLFQIFSDRVIEKSLIEDPLTIHLDFLSTLSGFSFKNSKEHLVCLKDPNFSDVKVEFEEKTCPKEIIPKSLVANLKQHQIDDLQWMISCENQAIETTYTVSKSSLYDKIMLENGDFLYYNKHNRFMRDTMPFHNGGILAREEGTGKTLTTLCLIKLDKEMPNSHKKLQTEIKNTKLKISNSISASEDYDTDIEPSTRRKGIKSKVQKLGRNLIVTRKGLMTHWRDQIDQHFENQGNPTYIIFYEIDKNSAESIEDYDIVITSYETILSDSRLITANWYRIILDEAHAIKNHELPLSKALNSIQAKFRWCITATPWKRNPLEIYGLLKFLKLECWEDFEFFKSHINKQNHKLVLELFRSFLMMPERQESFKINSEIVRVETTETEKHLYEELQLKTSAVYKKLKDQEQKTIFNSYLRRICNHPATFLSKEDFGKNHLESILRILGINPSNDKTLTPFDENARKSILRRDFGNCVVCYDKILECKILKCKHYFCSKCITKQLLTSNPDCPVCRKTIQSSFFVKSSQGKDETDFNDDEYLKLLDTDSPEFTPSSKFSKIIEYLLEIQKKKEKVLLFSEFVSTLSILELFLDKFKISYLKLSGDLSIKDREKILNSFKNVKKGITVLLLTYGVGSEGLDLSAANHVLIGEATADEVMERNAIMRVCRLGQEKEVFVKIFITENTIEEEIYSKRMKSQT